MIFTRVVPALLVAAVAAQAFYIPDALYAREFEGFGEFSERGLDHLNVVHDLATNNEVTVLTVTATDFAALGIRSEDVLSHILVSRMESPSPGPYECNSKADCQKHIDYVDRQIQEVTPVVARWKATLVEAAPKGSTAYRTAKNDLHTTEESLEGWQENKVDYERLKAHFPELE